MKSCMHFLCFITLTARVKVGQDPPPIWHMCPPARCAATQVLEGFIPRAQAPEHLLQLSQLDCAAFPGQQSEQRAAERSGSYRGMVDGQRQRP